MPDRIKGGILLPTSSETDVSEKMTLGISVRLRADLHLH